MVKISVITVCFNAISTLEKTILSVLNQSYPNIEYIIIDGGSTDGSVDIIKKYADRLFYWVSEPDKGIYDAMNKATSVATGDFLYFIGADDDLVSTIILSRIAENLKEKNTIYYGKVRFIPSQKIYGPKINKFRFSFMNIPHQAIFYPKHVFSKYKYDLSYPLFADYMLNINCYLDKSLRFCYINEVVCNFFSCGASSNSKRDINFRQEFPRFVYDRMGVFYFLCRKIMLLLLGLKHKIWIHLNFLR